VYLGVAKAPLGRKKSTLTIRKIRGNMHGLNPFVKASVARQEMPFYEILNTFNC
jgi:Flp pilus assembly CpaF family ATPase